MRSAFLAVALIASATAFALGEPKFSTLEVRTDSTPDSFAATFKVAAAPKHQLTWTDAPWKLELTGHDGLPIKVATLTSDAVDKNLPGFHVKFDGPASKSAGDLSYKLTAFVCTENKTTCYREVHVGKHSWKK